ncbi:MAG: hypothetical protein J1G02_02895 [Clostridiales bacterium]|nr:hypothetical protein [Clostridiales bacterium]
MNTSSLNKTGWLRIRTILLYLLIVLLVCSTVVIVIAEVFPNALKIERVETREQIKSRLMRQAKYEGWDPYSADMTLDEFYALMELFDEGKLPLDNKKYTTAETDETNDEPLTIPRTKFMFAGLPKSFTELGDNIDASNKLEAYSNNNDYEQYGVDDNGKNMYYYPQGLDPYNRGYSRPPLKWNGVCVEPNSLRALVVLENENADPAIASKVDQSLFVQYKDYYVKQVTVDGADINILGLIKMPESDSYVCYFLSAEEQSTQVSTTTMPDPQKFIIQYVPIEHMVSYKVEMADGSPVPDGIDEESVFGSYHPFRTTDGAYSFDVIVPYGYTIKILICIDMDKKLWFTTTPNGDGTDDEFEIRTKTDNTFPVSINHTGFYNDMKNEWLRSYYTYLCKMHFIDENGRLFVRRENGVNEYSSSVTVTSYEDFLKYCIHQEGDDSERNIVLTWAIDDPNKEAHDSMLVRMTERINDFMIHNDGYSLGTYPIYDTLGPGRFRLLTNENGPSAWTMSDTFYNHFVKADRTIVAVLTKLDAPTFDVRYILQLSDGVRNGGNGRATAAAEWLANNASSVDSNSPNRTATYNSEDLLLKDYEFHDKDTYADQTKNVPGDLFSHGNALHNLIEQIDGTNSWNWLQSSFFNETKYMFYNADDGTYSYTWMFQTNNGDYLMDVLEINGIGMQLPYSPLYKYNTNYNGPKADETHPWYVENKLADGATVRIELVMLFGSTQRIYRVKITGARSNVVVTGMNLMMFSGGSQEVSVYNLVGVYSDQNGESQTAEAIEYFGPADSTSNVKTWVRKAKSNVIVNLVDFTNGDAEHNGANFRFKVADGYGHPYYTFSSPRFGVIKGPDGLDQSSAQFDEKGNVISYNDIELLSEANGTLDSQHIYEGDDGYYYIRVSGQGAFENGRYDYGRYPIGLLTIVARTVRYVVRYVPDQSVEVPNPDNMPQFVHEGNCVFKGAEIGAQYDDNGGAYYDLLVNKMISIPSNENGVIRPADPSKDLNERYLFVDWMLVDEHYNPVKDKHGEEVHFLSGAIDLTTISHYAVHRVQFSTDDMDIYVIRFVPTWKRIDDPFVYSIVINWVDALGNVTQENFSNWDDIITETPETGDVYVYLNKVAAPFLNWFAMHPTYTFWDSVNNALDNGQIEKALRTYLEQVHHTDKYEDILQHLLRTDYTGNGQPDFVRLGGDVFSVHDDGGIISIWMYEGLGGVVFNTDVKEEAFVHDEEFYFTVKNHNSLNGTYRAFSEYVFNADGSRKDLTDADAWLITFKNGVIASIVKDGVDYGTYFKLRDGDEIALYVPDGDYEIIEMGSKSGGSYKVDVRHHDTVGNNPENSSWTLPTGDVWLKGSSTVIKDDSNISQVFAKVSLATGEKEIVEAVTFYNQTTAISIENHLGGMTPQQEADYKSQAFTFKVSLSLPSDQSPFKYEDNTSKYYFNMNLYRSVDGKTIVTSVKFDVTKVSDDSKGDNVWVGQLALKPEESAVIVMTCAVKYWVDEIETHSLVPLWTAQNGQVQIGYKAYVKCTNYLKENIPTVTQGYLLIAETGGKSNESFLFKITNENGVSMTVSVKGGGKTYVCVPLGKYTIEEISDWSWRYENGISGNEAIVAVEITALNATKDAAAKVTYSHASNNKGWLGGENSNSSFFAAA